MSCLLGPVLPKPGLPREWIKRQRPQTITTILYFVALHQPHQTQPTASWSLGIFSIIPWGKDYPCTAKSILGSRCVIDKENYILIIISPERKQQLNISPNPLHFTSSLIAWSQLGWTKQQSSQWVYSNQLYIYNENKKLASARQTEGHTDNIIVTKTCHHFPELQPSYLGQVWKQPVTVSGLCLPAPVWTWLLISGLT